MSPWQEQVPHKVAMEATLFPRNKLAENPQVKFAKNSTKEQKKN